MADYTLITGATGLLGRYLVRDLLVAGNRIAVVVRPSEKESAELRVEQFLQMWESQTGELLPRPVCLTGDVCQENLGLSDADCQWVSWHCHSVIHSAAVLTFERQADGEPWKTNVDGTENVLELCRLAGIRDFHYVSTAYVCGCREDVVLEEDLEVGQEFRNDYERSKFEAETLVRAADFFDCLTVYRPAVIAGDSLTGYTNTYHGLYLYLKLMSILVWNTEPGPDGVRDTPVQLNMTGNEPRNIIPVDWASAVLTDLFCNPKAHGRTYHLAPDQPITPREIIEAGYRYFNSRGVEFVGEERPSNNPISGMDRDAHQNMTMYESYEITDPRFDLKNLKEFAAHLPCPPMDESMLRRFWSYGEEDRWGKRRPPRPVVEFWMKDHLEQCRSATDDLPRFEGAINLDVTGPGGGQWHVWIEDDGVLQYQPGNVASAVAIVVIDTATFQCLLDSRTGDANSIDSFSLEGSRALSANDREALYAHLFARDTRFATSV